MTQSTTKETVRELAARELLEQALHSIGPAPQPSDHGIARARAAALAEWQRVVRGRARRRALRRAAGLGAVAAAIAIVMVAVVPWHSAIVSGTIATAAHLQGRVLVAEDDSTESVLTEGMDIAPASEIETADDALLALQLATGQSLRLDRSTRLRILAANEFKLLYGRVYVDSATDSERALSIATPLATVTDIGTQFQVSWRDQVLQIRVREGEVRIHGDRRATADALPAGIDAGEALLADTEHASVRSGEPSYGPQWEWVAQAAPAAGSPERRLDDVLNWICRELGYRLHYADERTRERAASIVLDGSLEGLTAQQALDVLPRITSFHYRPVGGELMLESVHDDR